MAHSLPLSYSIRSVLQRRTRTALTVAVMALVVVAVTVMLSLAHGIRRTLVETGERDNLIVLRKGATNDGASMVPIEAYRVIRFFPGIATDAQGEPIASPEMVEQPFFHLANGGRENVLVRGIERAAFAVHGNVRIAAGRAPRPSSGEALVGRAIAARYPSAAIGATLHFGRHDWRVVGILDSGGSSFESEVWVDVRDLWNDANRSVYSGIRLKTAPGADPRDLVRRIDGDARWALEAKPEIDYYREQAESANFLFGLTVVLAVIMGVGAGFGAMNTMFAAVSSRTTEIGTLRALGFSRRSILISFVAESLAIAAAGFVLGILLAVAATLGITTALHGVAVSLVTFSTAAIALRVSALEVFAALALSLLLGLTGGILPARRAARLSPVEALRTR